MPAQSSETGKVGAKVPWLLAIAVAAGVGWLQSTWAGDPYAVRPVAAVSTVLFFFGVTGVVFWWNKSTRAFIPPAMVILALGSAFGNLYLDFSRSSSDSQYPGGVSLGHTMAEDDSLSGRAEVRKTTRIEDLTFSYAVRESPTGLYEIGSLYLSRDGRRESSFLVFFYHNDLAPLARAEVSLTLERFGGGWEEVIPGRWRKEVPSGFQETEVWLVALEKEGRQLALYKEREFAEYLAAHLTAGVPFGEMGAAWPVGGE